MTPEEFEKKLREDAEHAENRADEKKEIGVVPLFFVIVLIAAIIGTTFYCRSHRSHDTHLHHSGGCFFITLPKIP